MEYSRWTLGLGTLQRAGASLQGLTSIFGGSYFFDARLYASGALARPGCSYRRMHRGEGAARLSRKVSHTEPVRAVRGSTERVVALSSHGFKTGCPSQPGGG